MATGVGRSPYTVGTGVGSSPAIGSLSSVAQQAASGGPATTLASLASAPSGIQQFGGLQVANAAGPTMWSPQDFLMNAQGQMGFTPGTLPWGGTDPTTGVNMRQDIINNAYNAYTADYLRALGAGPQFSGDYAGDAPAPGAAPTGAPPGVSAEAGVGISGQEGAALGGGTAGFGTGTAGTPGAGVAGFGQGAVGVPGADASSPFGGFGVSPGYGGLGLGLGDAVSGMVGGILGNAALAGIGVPATAPAPAPFGSSVAVGPTEGAPSGAPSSAGFGGDAGVADGGVGPSGGFGLGAPSAFGGPTGIGIGEASPGYGDASVAGFASDAGVADGGVGDGGGGGGGGGK